ncbi:hypothetical protein H1R20_g4792, partial [Candolleomyces eurysporus]
MSLVLNLFPTDLNYITAHLYLYHKHLAYSLSTKSNQSYALTMNTDTTASV